MGGESTKSSNSSKPKTKTKLFGGSKSRKDASLTPPDSNSISSTPDVVNGSVREIIIPEDVLNSTSKPVEKNPALCEGW
ncbi:hypothetical protein PM082_020987 [Marasmius tenuissimus]|nr:hypothetical protein PM082_020987 [Marasmius tenuissimus]